MTTAEETIRETFREADALNTFLADFRVRNPRPKRPSSVAKIVFLDRWLTCNGIIPCWFQLRNPANDDH